MIVLPFPEMCKAPEVPENGYFKCVKGSCHGYPVGTLLHYLCTPGYETMGSVLIECQEGGVWSGKGPVCVIGNVTAESLE